jgi:hypothetical protein
MPDLTTRVEEAFLGAVILDPAQLGDLLILRTTEDRLGPDPSDFSDPARRAVWAAVDRITYIPPRMSGPEMTDFILAGTDHPAITREYLTRLALSAPAPGAPMQYALMIIEAAVNREVAAAAPAYRPDADPTWLEQANLRVTNRRTAWSCPAGDLTIAGPPPRDQRAILEEQFLAGVISQPALADWLAMDAGVFTTPGTRWVYEAVTIAGPHGAPDEVILAWTAARLIASSDALAGQATTRQTLAEALPPGTIARLTAISVDTRTALAAGRDLLADHARAQISSQAAITRSAPRAATASSRHPVSADPPGRDATAAVPPPLQRPPEHRRRGPQLGQG